MTKSVCLLLPVLLLLGACTTRSEQQAEAPAETAPAPEPKPKKVHPPEPPPPELLQPVPLWKEGKRVGEIEGVTASSRGYVVLDVGEAWTPYLFSEAENAEGELLENAYRPTYLALARGEFPDNLHGERARDDKYLELYGIAPTLDLLRTRFRQTEQLECRQELDLQPLIDFRGLVTYRSNNEARRKARDFAYLKGQVARYMQRQKVEQPDELDESKLGNREKERLRRYRREAPDWFAVAATQDRLKCEGYFKGRGRFVRGALDWATHEALAEFERRHRVYSWGYLGRDTLAVLRVPPMEAERQAVLRVLTERAIHAAQVIEDGSTSPKRDGTPRTFKGADGKQHPIPNLVADLEQRIVAAFGLQTPESALAWLDSLGELPKDKRRFIAFEGPQLPEYYDGDMDLTLDYDRGDVWYDFPFDEEGKQLAQPVSRRPRVTLYTRYLDQKIPLARFGTTIGGWRSEQVGDAVMWRYKESPVGPRVWSQIIASPVWLPPDTTPPRDVLKRKRKRKANEPEFEVNYHETGPSYASAYGLVAAYHRKFLERRDGEILIGGDEGIRTHGSVDYMSIMRRHSHGCHRLHNHLAVRLMSFVLAHRPHTRVGQQPLAFKKELVHEEETYLMDITQGGYIFELDVPLKVNVLEGRIRGKVKEPMAFAVPKYDPDAGAYMTPDGGAVAVRGDTLVDVPLPEPDAGVTTVSIFDDILSSPAGDELGIGPPDPPTPPDPQAPPNPKSKPPVFFPDG